MTPALLTRMSSGPSHAATKAAMLAKSVSSSGRDADLVVAGAGPDVGGDLLGVAGPAHGEGDRGPRAGQRSRGLDADARTAAGDDRPPAGEIDPRDHLGGGRVQAERGGDAVAVLGHGLNRYYGSPACGTSTVAVSRTASVRGAARLFAEVGRGADQQRAAVVAAEHAGEEVQALGRRDLVDDLAAGSQAHAPCADLVGRPDVPLGVQRAAVGTELQLPQRLGERGELGGGRDLRPDAAVGQRAVVLDRERRVAGAGRLADDERRRVGGDHRAVGEEQLRRRRRTTCRRDRRG